MLVWIFQTGEPLHIDGEFARPMRAINLANSLIETGDEVVIWSSNFFHQKKKHRYKKINVIDYSDSLKINLIPSIGYKNNIGLGRLVDHAQLGLNLFTKLKNYKGPLPEKVFIGYPPIEFAFIAAYWCRKNKIPYNLDVKDMWPDIYIANIPKFLKKVAKILLYPYYFLGIWTCKKSSSISSITKGYLNWVYDFSNISPSKNDFVFPLSHIETINNSEAKKNNEVKLINNIFKKIDKNTKIILFSGSFSKSIDFETLIFTVSKAFKNEKNWIFVFCGDGPYWKNVNQRIGKLENTYLPGWVTSSTIKTLSKKATVGIAPYKNSPFFKLSISNKIYQYLSLGIPIFTSLEGTLQSLIKKHNIGINFNQEDKNSLYLSLEKYFKKSKKFKDQSKNAKEVYIKFFEGKIVYQKAVKNFKQITLFR